MADVISVLPLELLRAVAGCLDLSDICNLARSHPSLNSRLLGSPSFCKELVEKHIPSSHEAAQAVRGLISYRKALINTFQRRVAFALCRPYQILTIGSVSDFLYQDNTLCYLVDTQIHISRVHSGDSNVTLDLNLVFPLHRDQTLFRLVHYACGILTVRVRTPKGRKLAVFNVDHVRNQKAKPVLMLTVPPSRIEIVRNDSEHLVVGTYRGVPDGDGSTWEFTIYSLCNFQRRTLAEIGCFGSSEIDSNLVVDILDGHLWIISSQITEDPEGSDPTSHYGGCRINLSNSETVTTTETSSDSTNTEPSSTLQPSYFRLWRRQQIEGPIHDGWTTLSLLPSESPSATSRNRAFAEKTVPNDSSPLEQVTTSSDSNVISNSTAYILAETRSEWLPPMADPFRSFYITTFTPYSTLSNAIVPANPPEKGDTHLSPFERLAKASHAIDPDEYIETMLSEVSANEIDTYVSTREWCPEHYIQNRNPKRCILAHRELLYSEPQKETFRLPQILYRTFETSSKCALDIVLDSTSSGNSKPLLRLRTSAIRKIAFFPPRQMPVSSAIQPLFTPPSSFGEQLQAYSDSRLVVFGIRRRQRETTRLTILSFDPCANWDGSPLCVKLDLKDASGSYKTQYSTASTIEANHHSNKAKAPEVQVGNPGSHDDNATGRLNFIGLSEEISLPEYEPIMKETAFDDFDLSADILTSQGIEAGKRGGSAPDNDSEESDIGISSLGLKL